MADRKAVLVVDDAELNRVLLRGILEKDYQIMEAEDGKAALLQIKLHRDEICAVLLDIIMPHMDGFTVLTKIKEENLLDRIPVLLISADTSVEFERTGYLNGAFDFIHKPFDNVIVKARVDRAVELYNSKNRLEGVVDQQTSTLRRQITQLKKQDERLRQINSDILEIMSSVVEFRDVESGQHIKRIKSYTREIAKAVMENYPEYGLMPLDVDHISAASALHDIGKIAIPDSILLKPGKLTPEEFEQMKQHTVKGAEIVRELAQVQDPEMHRLSMEICRHHHEKYDGNGYPDGLKGDEIPIEAQIVALADVYDALTSPRVYKPPYSCAEAYKMIRSGECGSFSRKMLHCLAICRTEMEKIHSFFETEERAQQEPV